MVADPIKEPVWAIMAELDGPDELLEAARRARERGYREMQAYTPYRVEGLAAQLGMGQTWLPLVVMGGALAGAAIGYFGQYYARVIAYPYNIGGRPLHSVPLFIPITFEMGILVAALTALLAMLILNGLPQPYHPAFNLDNFEQASQDRFFLAIKATDPKFDLNRTTRFLESLDPRVVSTVHY